MKYTNKAFTCTYTICVLIKTNIPILFIKNVQTRNCSLF